jgi:hypothetical protein
MRSTFRRLAGVALASILLQGLFVPLSACAMPVFARQTGMPCMTCHAGGQFPELTPFGRNFKLTGYTLGQRVAVPLAVMGVASVTSTRDTTSDQPSVDFAKDAVALFQTGSVLFGGKITDKIGMFGQVTYENHAEQDPTTLTWKGHSHADNIDLRYATQWSAGGQDLVSGLSLNNNPSVSDLWNTAPAWIQYVPTAFGFTGPAAAPMVAQLGQQTVGLTGYTMWNNTVYAEVAGYHTPQGAFKLLTRGNEVETRLKGVNPYARLALTHVWGNQNAMVGLFGMNARVYPDAVGGPTTAYRDRGIDAQYQYLTDVHMATGQLSYIRETIHGGDLTGVTSNATDTLRQLRLKGSYIYRSQLGASLTWFNTSGTADATLYPGQQDDGNGGVAPIPISGSIANSPDTRGWIPELFWIPEQHARLGAQYFKYKRYNGAASNYDGTGRNARGNDTLFIYLWVAR